MRKEARLARDLEKSGQPNKYLDVMIEDVDIDLPVDLRGLQMTDLSKSGLTKGAMPELIQTVKAMLGTTTQKDATKDSAAVSMEMQIYELASKEQVLQDLTSQLFIAQRAMTDGEMSLADASLDASMQVAEYTENIDALKGTQDSLKALIAQSIPFPSAKPDCKSRDGKEGITILHKCFATDTKTLSFGALNQLSLKLISGLTNLKWLYTPDGNKYFGQEEIQAAIAKQNQ